MYSLMEKIKIQYIYFNKQYRYIIEINNNDYNLLKIIEEFNKIYNIGTIERTYESLNYKFVFKDTINILSNTFILFNYIHSLTSIYHTVYTYVKTNLHKPFNNIKWKITNTKVDLHKDKLGIKYTLKGYKDKIKQTIKVFEDSNGNMEVIWN